jgi:hypothetical protein
LIRLARTSAGARHVTCKRPECPASGLEFPFGGLVVMAAWLRIVMAAFVLVVPGGFVLLLAYLGGKAMRESWQRASANGGAVSLGAVVGGLSFRDLVKQARGAASFG